nr:MAG TPA: hypothetical protein [Bacteriophage sp.]
MTILLTLTRRLTTIAFSRGRGKGRNRSNNKHVGR